MWVPYRLLPRLLYLNRYFHLRLYYVLSFMTSGGLIQEIIVLSVGCGFFFNVFSDKEHPLLLLEDLRKFMKHGWIKENLFFYQSEVSRRRQQMKSFGSHNIYFYSRCLVGVKILFFFSLSLVKHTLSCK